MFGLSRSDHAQQSSVSKFAEQSFFPWDGGFAIRPTRASAPVFVTANEKATLVDAYADGINLMMRWLIIGLLLLMALMIAIDMALGTDPSFWQVMVAIGLLVPVRLFPMRRVRRALDEFPPRTRSVNEAFFKREADRRLRERPWSEILLPAAVIPFLYWKQRPSMPPATIDDHLEWAMLVGLSIIIGWAVNKKLRVGAAIQPA